LNRRQYGFKAYGFVQGVLIFAGGLQAGYMRESDKGYAFIRPELGFGWKFWSLTYGYNIVFTNQASAANRHSINLRVLIPIAPAFFR
jgi:hypothetical protein